MTAQRVPAPPTPRIVVVPAIDLAGGRSVRLVQGRYDRVVSYPSAPGELARSYARDGAELLHVVDLDGARRGSWQNLESVGQIVRTSGVPVQAGGGARDRSQIRAALRLGVARVVISSAAFGDRDRLLRLFSEFGTELAVSLDQRHGEVVKDGWTRGTGIKLGEAARWVVSAGASRLIYTDVLRDGTLAGPGVADLESLLGLGVPVMAAGGVRDVEDLARLRAAGAEAAIVGRALLDGRLGLGAAILAAGGPAPGKN